MQGDDILHTSRPAPPRDLGLHQAQAQKCARAELQTRLRIHLQSGDIRAAICYLEQLYLRDPSIARALHLGQLYRQCRAFQSAIAHLKAAHDLWPHAAEILGPLAEICTIGKEFQTGAACWRALIRQHKDVNLHAVLRAIACYRQIGDEDSASALLIRHEAIFKQKFPPAAIRLMTLGRAGADLKSSGFYLVTGNNGTGKTRTGHFLQMLGYQIVDADVEIGSFCCDGLCADVRYDLTQGDKTLAERTKWCWPRYRFDAIGDATRKEVFIIGGHGAIVHDHVSACRQVFHLYAPTEVIARRLAHRNSASHQIGSRGYIAALGRNKRESVPSYPATLLRSDRPVWKVCAELLAATPNKTSS